MRTEKALTNDHLFQKCPENSCGSASLPWNIREFGAKCFLTDHETANSMDGFRDSFLVLKIHGCYQNTKKLEQLSISIQAIQGNCSVLM